MLLTPPAVEDTRSQGMSAEGIEDRRRRPQINPGAPIRWAANAAKMMFARMRTGRFDPRRRVYLKSS